ncbi:glycoside hydrolase family 35 protein [Enterococcus songbeiensis]|uniref:glycoside hydrolase family 35 protein n=1 Tax=Enterococcus songbeiensis TaxID=2559927 RepID=UPI0010F986C7|nr:beta-galactosidase family protein [Enterococcus songbeiensis]
MTTFEIKKDFLLNGRPFKILSGAIHYFRIHPDDWYHSLYNLKALGFNTVETYIPWNLHEANKGIFRFDKGLDIEHFIRTAEEIGLYVIIRPSPYICAEWEFGGFPAWLLEEDCKIRTSDPVYLQHVKNYYQILFEKLIPLQITHDGPIIMMQIENEYGSFGEEKEYLFSLHEMMKNFGVDVPFFTSDGSWRATLKAGSMIGQDILPTGNFGSHGKENFQALHEFYKTNGKDWPLMCMEFWDGWFNRWGEPIVKRETTELVAALREVIGLGSVNLYMFHGGTNFGFMNGCSARKAIDLPQITSYDYGAPLDEQGNPTKKYFAIKKMLRNILPELPQTEPLVKKTFSKEKIPLTNKVDLFQVIDQVSDRIETIYPKTMEGLHHYYGYILYRTFLEKDAPNERYRIIDGRDRAQIYLNEEYLTTQYQEEIGEDILVTAPFENNQLDILMENMGRVNYGHKLFADTQRKGIRTGVMSDLHFITNWQQYLIDFTRISALDFSKLWREGLPAFYQFTFELIENEDTFIDLHSFGKGVVLVNGHNLGRFWDKGPTQSLYIPKGFLNLGINTIIIFETEGRYADEINLSSEALFIL